VRLRSIRCATAEGNKKAAKTAALIKRIKILKWSSPPYAASIRIAAIISISTSLISLSDSNSI
jgi:hypothetical protein